MGDMRTFIGRQPVRLALAGALAAGLTFIVASAQERDRSKVPEKYTWNLGDIYANEAAWRAAKERVTARIPELQQYKGKLGSSARALADALENMSALDKEVSRLYVYASMLADEDTRDASHQGMRQEMVQLASAFSAQESYIEPEILRLPKGTVEKAIASEPRLKVYSFYLHDIERRAAHTLSENEEKLLADAGPLESSPSEIYNIIANADFPYPSVTLSDGRTVKDDQAAYADLRALPNRGDREKIMSVFWISLAYVAHLASDKMHQTASQ